MVPTVRSAFRGVFAQPAWQPILRAGGFATLNRAVTIVIRLITIPLVVNFLGPERYGLAMTIGSIAGYVLLLDFGLGSALVNKLTHSYAAGDITAANRSVTGGMLILGALSAGLAVLALVLVQVIDWISLLRLSAVPIEEARLAIAIAAVIFLVQLPLSIVLRVPYTFQRGTLSEFYIFLGNVLTFAGILACIHLGTSLPFILFFMIAGTTIASIGLLIRLLVGGEVAFQSGSYVELKSLLRQTWKTGYDFFVMQAAASLMTALQFTLLAFYQGAEAVAVFSLLFQASLAIQAPFIALIQPMWTKVAELAQKGDYQTMRTILPGYFRLAIPYSILAVLFFLLLLDPVLNLVLTTPIPTGLMLRIGFAVTTSLGLLFGGGVGAVILGMSMTRQMAVITLLQFSIFLVVSLIAVPRLAALGTVLAVCAGYAVAAPGSLWILRKRLAAQA